VTHGPPFQYALRHDRRKVLRPRIPAPALTLEG